MKKRITTSNSKLFRMAVVALLDAVGLKSAIKNLVRRGRAWGIPKSEPCIVCVIPHDSSSFTQGLHIHDGILYESSGIVGESSLRVIDRQTGKVIKTVPVKDGFAEGIAAVGDRMVQLTWREEMALVYRLPDLISLESHSYAGEGWGMSATAERYLTSDGSDEIAYRDLLFRKIKTLKVRINGFPLKGINDLAWVNGTIYCNVLRDDNIYQVDESSGRVLHILNCSRLSKLGARSNESYVLNGIAYDQLTDSLFITGKRWKYYFQVRLSEFEDS